MFTKGDSNVVVSEVWCSVWAAKAAQTEHHISASRMHPLHGLRRYYPVYMINSIHESLQRVIQLLIVHALTNGMALVWLVAGAAGWL